MTDILAKLLIICGTPKCIDTSKVLLIGDLLSTVSSHFFWLEKTSIFIKWMLFYNACLDFTDSECSIYQKKSTFCESDGIISNYLENLEHDDPSNFALKYYYDKVEIETYLETEKIEHLTPRLKSLIKTLISNQFINTRELIKLLKDITSARSDRIKVKVEKDHNIGQSINLPRLFSLLGRETVDKKGQNISESELKKSKLLEELIVADPIITRLTGFTNLIASINKVADDEFYDNPDTRTNEEELRQIWDIFTKF